MEDIWEEEGKKWLRAIAEHVKDAYRESIEEEASIFKTEGADRANEFRKNRHSYIIEQMETDFYPPTAPCSVYVRKGFEFYKPDSVVSSYDETFHKIFHCRNFWVELELERRVTEEKVQDLKRILSHDWLILILEKAGSYRIERPSAWEKVKELREKILEF